LVERLRWMLTIRHFGERASAVYLAGKICGVVHCYIGEKVKASASAAPSTVATESSWHIAATATASQRPQPHDWRALRDARSGSENWTQHGRAQHRPGALRLVPRSAPPRHAGRAPASDSASSAPRLRRGARQGARRDPLPENPRQRAVFMRPPWRSRLRSPPVGARRLWSCNCYSRLSVCSECHR
jgi:hypothetical protein